MADFPYTTVIGKLKDFLAKIREVGVPEKATYKWLESLGFKSTNDRSIISVIKFIGLLDENGVPTERWNLYRGGKHKMVLAKAIIQGYSELYSTYTDAHHRSTTELENFFSTRTTAGKQVVLKTVSTYKTLCELANFSGNLGEVIEENPSTNITTSPNRPEISISEKATFSPSLHIDVQIHISPDTTPEQIDHIFSSMNKHIFMQEGKDGK